MTDKKKRENLYSPGQKALTKKGRKNFDRIFKNENRKQVHRKK